MTKEPLTIGYHDQVVDPQEFVKAQNRIAEIVKALRKGGVNPEAQIDISP